MMSQYKLLLHRITAIMWLNLHWHARGPEFDWVETSSLFFLFSFSPFFSSLSDKTQKIVYNHNRKMYKEHWFWLILMYSRASIWFITHCYYKVEHIWTSCYLFGIIIVTRTGSTCIYIGYTCNERLSIIFWIGCITITHLSTSRV